MHSTLTPDAVLSIYYLEGAIPDTHQFKQETFIGNWEEEGFSFLFFLQPAPAEVKQLLARYPHLVLLDEFEMTYAQWQGGETNGVQLGRFHLIPPWENTNVPSTDIGITLNSGVVFGNGSHPTTRDCLEAMEIACAGGKVKHVIDLGTGTGVLALAAARLGCEKVLAVDFNLLACRTTAENVHLNGLTKQILTVNGKAEELLYCPSDLLVANIHYAVMKELVRCEGFLQQKWFILSGLLQSETVSIIDYLETQPVALLKQWSQNGVWNTLLGITLEQTS